MWQDLKERNELGHCVGTFFNIGDDSSEKTVSKYYFCLSGHP